MEFFQKTFFYLCRIFYIYVINQLKQKQMKKSITAIKTNPEFVLVLGFIALLITAVTYNIVVHGITSTAAFEF